MKQIAFAKRWLLESGKRLAGFIAIVSFLFGFIVGLLI